MDDGSKVTDTIVLYRIYLYIRHKWNFFCQAANLFSGELLILLFRIVLFHYNHYFHSFGETILNNETKNVKKNRTTDFDQNSPSKIMKGALYMPEYKLEIKQLVSYPRCRIYREFLQSLTADRGVRTSGRPGLFCFSVLCSYANFRTSYLHLDGITYTIYPGEWICRMGELTDALRLRFKRQTLEVLAAMQDRHLIQYSLLGRGNLVKYKIINWHRHNTVLDYNCPCQKETGFFFLPVSIAVELVGAEKCSEMDILLDLWISAVYRDDQVQGSFDGPVVYLHNGTGCPLVSYAELAQRWGAVQGHGRPGAAKAGEGGPHRSAHLPRPSRDGHLPAKLSVHYVPDLRRDGGQG